MFKQLFYSIFQGKTPEFDSVQCFSVGFRPDFYKFIYGRAYPKILAPPQNKIAILNFILILFLDPQYF